MTGSRGGSRPRWSVVAMCVALAVDARVLDRDRRAPRELLGELEVGAGRAAAGRASCPASSCR